MSGKRRIRFIGFTLFLIFSLTAGLYSCGEVTGSKKDNLNAPTVQPGKLYISNLGDGSLIAFDNALTAEGNIPPTRRFPESITGPTGIFLDQASDTLYVANTDHNAILIYEQAGTLNPPVGFASATRVISGVQTGLNHPYAVVYDAGRGLLYVANKENSIVVFKAGCAGAASLGGNIAPCRTLSGAATLLDFPRGLALDAGRDILYISNMGSDSILVYADASQSTTQGNLPPTREIRGHLGPEVESILELPFGLAIDPIQDRLYVVNIGRNRPAILIFESASSRSGESIPERLITGQKTQLSQPAGIHLDAASGRLYVVNSNNTNNGPTAVVVFSNISTQCTAGTCDLSPSQSITGQSTGLTNPSGIAFNPKKELIYIGNTGGNNILLYSLDGNISPLKLNSGNFTTLESPSGFYYDSALDRLYIINFTAFLKSSTDPPHITIYDNVSNRNFANTPPDWIIRGSKITENANTSSPSTQQEVFSPRGIYVDKTRGYLLVLSTSFKTQLLVYDLKSAQIDVNSPTALLPQKEITLPCMGHAPPVKVCDPLPPAGRGILSDGLSTAGDGPTAMAVDEKNGNVYVADQGNNSIIVYNLDSFTKKRTITGLNRPFGLFIDTVRDILYVANAGGALGANANTANTIFAFSNASTKSGNVSPERIFSSSADFAAEDKLDFPTSLFVNTLADRLFIVNQSKNSIFIFDDAGARPTGATRPDRKLLGTNTGFAFSGNTSALWVDSQAGKETLYVGQSKDPTCDPAVPLTCPRGALLGFGAQGNVPPSKTWSGGEAPLAGPSAIAVDTTRDILYTANQGDPAITADDSLFSFSDVSLIQGSLQNHRKVCSPATPSSPCPDTKLNNPAGLFIDSGRNRLYVSNSGTNCSDSLTRCNSILVFFVASGLVDDSMPDLIINGPAINNPHGLTLDTQTKTLYVANTGGHSVLVFKNIEALNGDLTVATDAEINGIQSRINAPVGVAIDPKRDILYVLNQGAPEILVFERASTRNGNTPPDRIISGSGFMVKPSALFLDPNLDPNKDLLYVADQGANAVYIFNGPSSAQGQAEHKTLTGNNTGLNQPSALFVDTTR